MRYGPLADPLRPNEPKVFYGAFVLGERTDHSHMHRLPNSYVGIDGGILILKVARGS
jgi:hypothetical protein